MTDNTIQVLIDDGTYEFGFQEIIVSRAIDDVSGRFRLITVGTKKDFPIKEGMSCQISINNTPFINGFIEKIQIKYDSSSHSLFIEGRDKTADLIDSDVDNGSFSVDNPISLKQLIELVLQKLNLSDIKVIDQIGDLDPIEDLDNAGEDVGVKALEYINRYTVQRQVLLQPDGLGNIVITRAATTESGATLLNTVDGGNKSNILSADGILDSSQLYNKYVVHSQQNLGYTKSQDVSIENATNTENFIQDDRIRTSRIKSFYAENPSDVAECLKRAQWEKSLSVAKSQIFQYRVYGFDAVPNTPGGIWIPNTLVQVKDDFLDINAKLLVKLVEFTQSNNDGSKTQLTLVPPDAYTLQDPSKVDLESESVGNKYLKNPR